MGQVQDAVDLANSLPARVASCQIKDGAITLVFWADGAQTVPGRPGALPIEPQGPSDADLALSVQDLPIDPEVDDEG